MAFPTESTCTPWAEVADLPEQCSAIDADLAADMLQVASDILFDLTGRRWPGACASTVRPAGQFHAFRNDIPRAWPATANAPYGLCSCARGRMTGCGQVPEIRLPGGPVDPAEITVKVDGDDFPFFELHDGRWLVRTDGQGWPCCQDMTLSDDELHTWSVTYTRGGPPPIGGRRAAAYYACQLALGWTGGAGCKLPERVTSITRQGVSIAVLDPLTLLSEGRTGLTFVDSWVASVWRGRAKRRATVITPGNTRSVRRKNPAS